MWMETLLIGRNYLFFMMCVDFGFVEIMFKEQIQCILVGIGWIGSAASNASAAKYVARTMATISESRFREYVVAHVVLTKRPVWFSLMLTTNQLLMWYVITNMS